MRNSFIAFLIIAVLVTVALPKFLEASAQEPNEQGLTLDEVVSRVVQMSPSLAAGVYAVSAAEARVTQVGLFPNPEILLEAENFGGSGDSNGFNAAESTAVISQPILLGGKRRRHRAVAESEHMLAGRDLEAVRLDVIAEATSAFYRVLVAQQREALAGELLGLAEQLASTVQAKVDAGKASPVEATRASIEVAQARVRLSRAVRELGATRALLVATWGSSVADFDRAVGGLPELTLPATHLELRPLLMMAPEITRLENQVVRQQRVLDLENSFRIPDLTISLGPRRFEETGQSAWVAGLSLPIPIFDRNQGARRAAEFELERTRSDSEAVRVNLDTKLAALLERLHAAAQEATAMDREIVPAASAALAATEIGYSEGKFGFLNVLDAQRVLFEARSLLLDSREEYALTHTELERMTGLSATPKTEPASSGYDRSQGEPQ